MIDICNGLLIGGIVSLIFGFGGTFLIPTPFGRYIIPLGAILVIMGALGKILLLC